MSGDSEALEHAKALRDGLRWALGVLRLTPSASASDEFRRAEDALLRFGEVHSFGPAGGSPEAMMDRGERLGPEAAAAPDEPAAVGVAVIEDP